MGAGKAISVVVVLAGVFLWGQTVGRGHVPEPEIVKETKIVTLRIPDTHVVTKEVAVVKPIPASCVEAYKLFEEDQPDYDKISQSSGDLELIISDSGIGVTQKNVTTLNDAQTRLAVVKTTLDSSFAKREEAKDNFIFRITECNKEMPK